MRMLTSRPTRLIITILVIGLLSLPAFANSQGPPYLNSDNNETSKYGCSCHGNGVPGDRAVVMISGVPVMYDIDTSYEMIVTVADSFTLAGEDGNTKAGFLLTDYGLGEFSWNTDEEIRSAEDNPDAISQSDTTNGGVWVLTWTAPSNDSEAVHFNLVGNSVNGDGIPNEYDYWNILSFSIHPPGTIVENDNEASLQTRTIAVGDYETLFVLEESESEIEAQRQAALSDEIFAKGNLYYWTSLTALIVGAVFQREIMERRYGPGPEYLASELAYPQGLRRLLISLVALVIAVNWSASGTQHPFIVGVVWFISAWAAYGVYRTVRSARAEQTVHDVM